MIEKNIKGLTASHLRIVLTSSILFIIAASAVGFYFIQSELRKYAVTVSHATEDARTSDNDIQVLRNLEKQLDDDRQTVERAQNIVSESKSYAYQPVIVDELNSFAERAGITISSFEFSTSGSTAATSAPPATAAQATSIPGIKSTTVSISLVAPTKYKDLLNFIHSIEQNLTKMQIASVSLTKGSDPDEVSTGALLIEVYIR